MFKFFQTIRFILKHPLNQGARWQALLRYGGWQLGSRLVSGTVAIPFVDEARLLVAPGMTGATGNIYTGLHEYEDMAFVLDVLRPGDLFVDVGANVGSYTVLAAAVCGSNVIAVEPVPESFEQLIDNINLNRIADQVQAVRCGVAAKSGELYFSSDLDTMNHVVASDHPSAISVPVKALDDILADKSPVVLKIDVEGFEHEVLSGGSHSFSVDTLQAVIIESNGSNARYAIEHRDVHESLVAFGFSPFFYFPRSRTITARDDFVQSQGNILYLRDPDYVVRRLSEAPTRNIRGHAL